MPVRSLAAGVTCALAATAQADLFTFTATMNGPSESPPNNSTGTGTAIIDWDTTAHTMRVRSTFSGLGSATTAAHLHAATTTPLTGTANPATQVPSFTGFPLNVTSGSMDQTYNLTLAATYNPAFITANGGTTTTAEAALLAALQGRRAYFNIHTVQYTNGEIRGFMIPGPGAAGLLAAGTLFAMRRRRG